MDAARKAKLGERWTCFSCASKFYDLHKPEPLCPKCGTNQRESPLFKQKSTKKKSAPKKPPKKLAPEPPAEDEEVEIEGTLEPEELLEASGDDAEQLEMEDLDMGEDEDLSAVDVVDED
jgi:hypothetical protein